MDHFQTIILGGGISGLSLASFLKVPTLVLEAEQDFGGLCRSYDLNGIKYDIGPHIIFSKNQEVLNLHTSIIPTNRLYRSNKVFYKGNYVRYPFENDLAALPEADKQYCLQEFLTNPYETFEANNMLQFFLKTFGEGITRSYLQPYNEKIWKLDPSCLDTQMVERIPKPPKEDVIKSAAGEKTEGYTHQLYYHYPQTGGFQTLVNKYAEEAEKNGHRLLSDSAVKRLSKSGSRWFVETTKGTFSTEQLVNTIPLHELSKCLSLPSEVAVRLANMMYNSIYIVMVQVVSDTIGDNFALYVPDKDIIFHRLSKLNYLGPEYCLPHGGSTLMAEVTFRPGSQLSQLDHSTVAGRVVGDLAKLGFITTESVLATKVHYSKYAYVIYDLNHRANTDFVLRYLSEEGIESVGRFAEFEYINSDAVVERTLELARLMNGQAHPDWKFGQGRSRIGTSGK